MKNISKFLISMTILMFSSFGFSKTPNQTHEEQPSNHHDWNKVFPQPTPNKSKATPPASSKILSPSYMEKLKGTEASLKWESIPSVYYHLQVATDPQFKWLIVDSPLMGATEYVVKNLKPNQQYFWRVYTQIPDNKPSYTKGAPVSSMFETVE